MKFLIKTAKTVNSSSTVKMVSLFSWTLATLTLKMFINNLGWGEGNRTNAMLWKKETQRLIITND